VDKVRVNAVLPAMATPMYQEAMARSNEAQRTASYWRNRESIALGQEYGDPDRDLGPVMVFLASDASHFITGQLIPVDGGQTSVR
jgi:3-oxoacyl-[acyl-carrier protein] reductase